MLYLLEKNVAIKPLDIVRFFNHVQETTTEIITEHLSHKRRETHVCPRKARGRAPARRKGEQS